MKNVIAIIDIGKTNKKIFLFDENLEVVSEKKVQFEEIKDWLENPVPGVWVLRTEIIYSRTTGLKCNPPEGNAFFG